MTLLSEYNTDGTGTHVVKLSTKIPKLSSVRDAVTQLRDGRAKVPDTHLQVQRTQVSKATKDDSVYCSGCDHTGDDGVVLGP